MRTAKQLIKEFWAQIIISIIWGAYKVSIAPSTEHNASTFITNFSASLFLLSWMLGQVIRVKKQHRIEDEFGHLKKGLNDLLLKIQTQTKDLIGFSTGGDSVAYFSTTFQVGTSVLNLGLLNDSEYPVFDFQGDWIDLDEPGVSLDNGIFWTRHKFNFGDIHPKRMAMNVINIDMATRDKLRVNIFCTTRNRIVTQQIRVLKVNGILKIASQVTSENFKKNMIAADFPNYDPENPDNVFK